MNFRLALLGEVILMAFETVRTNKLRSALTVLGVVIGITSIVGVTAMVLGFDESLRSMIRTVGPNTIFVQRFGIGSFVNGVEFRDLIRRPNLTVADARALEQQAETIELVDLEIGGGGPAATTRRVSYRDRRTLPMVIFGASENFAQSTRIPLLAGRFFNGTEVHNRKNVVVLGNSAYEILFVASGTDPTGKMVRIGTDQFEVVGAFDKRAAAGGFNLGQDDFVVVPHTVYQRLFGLRAVLIGRGGVSGSILPIQIALMPRDGVSQEKAIEDVERVMRIRHDLKLDEPDDFDILTQDSVLQLWDQISQGTFLALVVMSSIALIVGGIGVMAIMSISVTERTREIGVRMALGARRSEILFQFLVEAAFLTSLGGAIGIVFGSVIGWAVHFLAGLPVSLPWWSFVIGLGFSASVGIFFGMYPAVRASRLDPIEALRHE